MNNSTALAGINTRLLIAPRPFPPRLDDKWVGPYLLTPPRLTKAQAGPSLESAASQALTTLTHKHTQLHAHTIARTHTSSKDGTHTYTHTDTHAQTCTHTYPPPLSVTETTTMTVPLEDRHKQTKIEAQIANLVLLL